MGTRRVQGSVPLKLSYLEEGQEVAGVEVIIRPMEERRSVPVEVTAGEVW